MTQSHQLKNYYAKMQETIRQDYASLNRRTLRDPEIIFVGDSLIHLFELEKWLSSSRVMANRGLSAYTTRDLWDYLDIHVFGQALQTLFVLIGTNDIGLGVSKEATLENLRAIFETVKSEYPMVTIKLLEILPVSQEEQFVETVGLRSNGTIRAYNQALAEMVDDYAYVDLVATYANFTDELDQLALPLTKDGLHLTPQGYEVLAKIIQTELDSRG